MNPSQGVLFLCVLLAAVAGCGETDLSIHSQCPPGVTYDDGHKGPNGQPDPCHLQDAKCTGECVPRGPVGWDPPFLLWMGPEAEVPACPEKAPLPGFTGWADPTGVPLDCPACTCDLPTGKCVLPEKVDVFTAPKCAGVSVMPWDAPPNWDGTCTDANAILAGQLCNGIPCVRSILIDAPKIEATCASANIPPPHPARKSDWGQFARACLGGILAACASPGEVCVPTSAPPPPGFRQCISREGEGGDRECPIEYPHRSVFYDGKMDTRGCTQCTCGDPIGGVCKVKFTQYDGAQCTPPSLDIPLVSTAPADCFDMPPGNPLAGKSAKVTSLDLGKCPSSGGEPTGTLEPSSPWTFCCR